MVDYIVIGLVALLVLGDLVGILYILNEKYTARFAKILIRFDVSDDFKILSEKKHKTIKSILCSSILLDIVITLLVLIAAFHETDTVIFFVLLLAFVLNKWLTNWYINRLVKRERV